MTVLARIPPLSPERSHLPGRWQDVQQSFPDIALMVACAREHFTRRSRERRDEEDCVRIYKLVAAAMDLRANLGSEYTIRAHPDDMHLLDVRALYGGGKLHVCVKWCGPCNKYSLCTGMYLSPIPPYTLPHTHTRGSFEDLMRRSHETWKNWRDLLFFDIAFCSADLPVEIVRHIRSHLPSSEARPVFAKTL
jgi:hypothetical protein